MTNARAELHEESSCSCVYNRRHLLIVDEADAGRTKLIALYLPPRPEDARLGMTRVGVLRDEYNASIEGNPPRFISTPLGFTANPAYFEWAARADTWAGVAALSPSTGTQTESETER